MVNSIMDGIYVCLPLTEIWAKQERWQIIPQLIAKFDFF